MCRWRQLIAHHELGCARTSPTSWREVSLTEHHADTIGLKKSGCHGFCEMGPLVRIEPEGWLVHGAVVSDGGDHPEDHPGAANYRAPGLAYRFQNGELYERQEDIPFYKKQTRRVLEHCGHIDAESIEEYLSIGGYGALAKASVRDAQLTTVQAGAIPWSRAAGWRRWA